MRYNFQFVYYKINKNNSEKKMNNAYECKEYRENIISHKAEE